MMEKIKCPSNNMVLQGQASHPCHLYAHSLNIPEQRKWLSRETVGLDQIGRIKPIFL